MNSRIFNWKNTLRSLIIASITLLLYCGLTLLFKDEVLLRNAVLMFVVFFLMNFLLGDKNLTWRELFGKITKKK